MESQPVRLLGFNETKQAAAQVVSQVLKSLPTTYMFIEKKNGPFRKWA